MCGYLGVEICTKICLFYLGRGKYSYMGAKSTIICKGGSKWELYWGQHFQKFVLGKIQVVWSKFPKTCMG